MSQPPQHPPHPGPQPPDDDPDAHDDLRAEARATLKDCKDKWTEFRTEAGTLLNDQVTRTFGYFQGILDDGDGHPHKDGDCCREPTGWVKDGIALWIGYYRSGRGIWDETYKLCCGKSEKK